MAVSETNDMSHDVFFPCCDESTEVCVYHEGRRSKLELEPNGVFELPVEIVPHNARTTGKNGSSGLASSLSELGQIEGMVITIANSKYMRCLKRARKATGGPRRTREDATRRIAMQSGKRCSRRTGCEGHEGSVGTQFEKGKGHLTKECVCSS